MAADTYTPTSYEDRGDSLYFRDVSGVSIVVPKESEKAGLYLRRLNAVTSARLDRVRGGERVSVPQEVSTYAVDVEIPSAEILTLASNPKTIIPAPGAGKKIQLVGISMFLDYNATAYTDASQADFVFAFRDTAGARIATAAAEPLVTAGEDANLEIQAPTAVSGDDDATSWVNQPMIVYLSAALTLGDSPILVRAFYRIDETGL